MTSGSQAIHLADNIDYLFHPFGIALPDPAHAGERLEEQLSILERAGTLWNALAGLGVDFRWYLQCSTMTDVDTVAFAVPVT